MVDFSLCSSNVWLLKKKMKELQQETNENPNIINHFGLYDACWYKGKMFLIAMCGAFLADAGIREKVTSLFLKL